jgi:membrane-bound metal-dependent hydrolase YbcI (DUF457 family)
LFAIGHFALGYLFGKYSAKLVNTKLNFALLFTASILPDIDFMFLQIIKHRGPTHSILFCILLFVPLFIKYKKKALPYFVALISHSLIGDIFSGGGSQLLWPLSNQLIYISNFSVTSNTQIALEIALFLISTIVMLASKDIKKIITQKSNILYWILPLGSVLGPILLTSEYYTQLPALLFIPSLYYTGLILFTIIFQLLKNLRLLK